MVPCMYTLEPNLSLCDGAFRVQLSNKFQGWNVSKRLDHSIAGKMGVSIWRGEMERKLGF